MGSVFGWGGTAEIIPHYHSVTHGLSAEIYKVFVLGDYTMRKWFKDIDADDIRMAVLASVLTLAFGAFLVIWYHVSDVAECGINCPTDFSAARRN